jgi:hypothetical protein
MTEILKDIPFEVLNNPDFYLPKKVLDLCDICQSIQIEKLTSSEGYQHTSKSLASESCPLCERLFRHTGNHKEEESTPIHLGVS